MNTPPAHSAPTSASPAARAPIPFSFRSHFGFVAGSVLLALVLSSGCHRAAPPTRSGTSLPRVRAPLVTVTASPSEAIEESIGTVRAIATARLEAKIAGTIETIHAEPGRKVATGTSLVTLNVREWRARLAQAVALRDQAENDLRRLTTLFARGAVTQAELESAQARARVAAATVLESETQLGYADIQAPFDGVITRKWVEVGDVAAPGKPLVEIEDSRRLRVETDVPESLVQHLRTGQTLTVHLPALALTHTGTVSELAPSADAASRTFRVKLDLPADVAVRPGTFARVGIPVPAGASLRIPTQAIVQRGQLQFAFVSTNGQAQLRLIRTGKQTSTGTEILSGLDAGERIVASGVEALHDGQPLEEINP